MSSLLQGSLKIFGVGRLTFWFIWWDNHLLYISFFAEFNHFHCSIYFVTIFQLSPFVSADWVLNDLSLRIKKLVKIEIFDWAAVKFLRNGCETCATIANFYCMDRFWKVRQGASHQFIEVCLEIEGKTEISSVCFGLFSAREK